jgi:serine/threonine-protein kinase
MVTAGSSTFSKGDRVDRYEIRELIGQGGMGAIYRAVDTKIGRTVALKVVRADRLGVGSDDPARQRFLREALAISKVDHRNVVRVLDFGFSGDAPYLAMEYLRGIDLGRLVKASADPLPIAEVVDVMLGVCAAVRACHEAGIIHRDLKPSNIFLCETDSERVVKILDFGVSKAPIASDLTREGQIVGTPQYLAPEQIDGGAVPQTDQYAIGVMLYLCVTKSLPYQSQAGAGLLRAILLGKFTPPSALRADLPQRLEGIILRAMHAAPEERFESVHALGRDLLLFASATAREQWRPYYLDDRLRAAAPKASTHAMPLIEAMARGLAGAGPPGVTPDSPLAPPPVAAPAVASPSPPAAATPARDSMALASTATAGPSAAASRIGAGARRTVTASLVAVGALVLAGAGWLFVRGSRGADAPKALAPAAPAVSTTVGPTSPAPAAPTIVPPPAPAPPAVARPAPMPAASSRPPARAQAAVRTTAPPEKASRRRNNRPPAPEHRADGVEHAADGVPIMP